MIEQLLNHIQRHGLCKTTDKILLAVSGGLDSMVMFYLLRAAGFKIAVAHCNFQLRGAESDGDAALVGEACDRWDVPFHTKRFDTTAYAAAKGISIQMAARELRYVWFREVAQACDCDYVATAHHFDDVTETVFLNLVRGSGIDGFRGIAPVKDKIIRPLLFATRKMIAAYAAQENIMWRDDTSNASDDYQRNFMRHHVIPRFQELNPGFSEGFRETQERLLGAREMMHAFLENFRRTSVDVRDKITYVDIARVRQSPSPAVLLWELIKDLGFKYDHCRKITADHQPGKMFHSSSHQLLVDRTQYIIEQKQVSEFLTRTLEKGQQWIGDPPFLLSATEFISSGFQLVKSSSIAQLDADKLKFPLVWRRWQAGDYFVPLGMQQEKKLSDFLIDLKVPFNSKADVTVLESGKDIAWVVGLRISERYKVTADTKRILVIEQKQNLE